MSTSSAPCRRRSQVCTSLLQCFITAAESGLRGGDIASVFKPLLSPDLGELSELDTFKFYFQSFYAFTFWFIIVIVLLNAVFGIIVDSFGELRARRKEIKKKNETECFICGIERFKLDTQGGGFKRHITLHHNMWSYLRMFTMLREKPQSDYNGWESYIASLMAKCDTSFLPQDALALKAITEMELAEQQRKQAREERTAATVAEMATSVAAIKERHEHFEAQLTLLTQAVQDAPPEGSTV